MIYQNTRDMKADNSIPLHEHILADRKETKYLDILFFFLLLVMV